MKIVLVAIDTITVVFASGLGLQVGFAFQPNIFAFVVSFFALRTLLQWLFYNSIVHRSYPWGRGVAQFVILLIVLPALIFVGYFVPGLTSLVENPKIFYFLLIPIFVALISTVFQRYFQLEPWQA